MDRNVIDKLSSEAASALLELGSYVPGKDEGDDAAVAKMRTVIAGITAAADMALRARPPSSLSSGAVPPPSPGPAYRGRPGVS